MSARLLLCLVVVGLLLPIGSTTASVPQDEVLILVASGGIADAFRVSPSPLVAYQRFAEGYLFGAQRSAVRALERAGVAYRMIDERPWDASYAVVTHRDPAVRTVAGGLPVQILHREGDAVVVKADRSTLELLRASGYQAVEITGEPVPVEQSVTHLPPMGDAFADDSIRAIVARVSDSSIYYNILGLQNFGTRYWGNANRDSVARWIRRKYLDAGITNVLIDTFTYSSGNQFNVVATTPGNVTPAAEIIVGGHSDAISSNTSQAPGADDNASGTVAAIEMARVLQSVNYRPNLTLRFMAYGTEEAGLVGSNSYATRARNANRDIRAMLNYDMIANRTQSQTDRDVYVVWYTGAEALSNLNSAMMRAYTTLTPVQTTSYRSGSDSYSFWQRNYKSTFVIERDFSPYYHTPNDLLQYLDMAYAREVVQSGLAMLLTLDKMPPAVAGLRVRDRGDGVSLVVSWDSTEALDLTTYRVRVGRSSGVYDSTYNTAAKSMLVRGLTAGTRYYTGVSMVDQVAQEGMITELSGVPRVVPLSPGGLTSQSGPNAVSLRWRKNLEVDLRGYHLYRRTGTSGPFARLTVNPLTDTLRVDTAAAGSYQYYATALDSTGNESTPSDTVAGTVTTGVGGGEEGIVYAYRLEQNYPNPFNPMTQIPFEVAAAGRVRLTVHDVLGREVATLVDREMEPGRYTAAWDARGQSTGVYFTTYAAGGRVFTMKMTLVR